MRVILGFFGLLGSGLALALAGCGAADLNLPSDGRPVALRAVSGGGQEATVGSRLPAPLIVGVRDGAGKPVPQVQLVFRFQNEFPDAEIHPSQVRTDGTGQASVEVTLGSTAGSQTVEATMAEDVAPNARALFGVTALERRGRGRDGGGGGKDKEKDKDGD
jgi:Big-like domain-containing protein